jgi:polysaccharide chain length determinant protein (PEP-CTERM system associated)
LWRRRWYAAGIAWLFCALGWGYVLQLPNIYEAKARIYVDTDSMLRPLMRGIAVDSNILTQVDAIQRTLLSRPNLQRVTHMADLDLGAHTPTEVEDVLNDLRRRTTVSGDGRNLFSLSYTGPSRDTSVKVVQSLLTVFVESNLGNSRKDMASARVFIDDQLREYAKQLDAAERRVAEFKANNVGYLPGENNYGTKLDAAKEELSKTQAELDESKHQRDELLRQLASVPRLIESANAGPNEGFGAGPPIGAAGGGPADAGARIAELEQKIKTLRESYTDDHPDVVRANRLLEQAKQEAAQGDDAAQQANANAAPTAPRAVRTTAPNPVYDHLQIQLVSLETTIASLESRVTRNEATIQKWSDLAKSVPEVAADMAKLTRDYDVIKKSYDELLNRRESAKIGSDLETQTQTVQFRIVDPPEAPPTPIAPKRPLLLALVLVGGVVAGAAFVFLLAQADDSVSSVRELKDVLSLPVLGGISKVITPAQRRQRVIDTLAFTATSLALVVAYITIVSFGILSSTPGA